MQQSTAAPPAAGARQHLVPCYGMGGLAACLPRRHARARSARRQLHGLQQPRTVCGAVATEVRSGTGMRTQSGTETQDSASQYNWFANWWPLLSEEMMHKDKPNAITVLGRQLVVWWDQPQAKWVVQEDSCPHRMTRLSEGRITTPGQLTCSYHGWEFNAQGACTRIPQVLPSANASTPPAASKRACVRTYPSQVAGNLLFAWLDASPEGLAKSTTKDLPIPKDILMQGPWGINEAPNEWRYWVEQSQDPGHANFLHVGFAGFSSEDATPIEAKPIGAADVSLDGGFVMHHGGYEKRNAGMIAKRRFIPPSHFKVEYDYPSGFFFDSYIFFVPVQPGVTRTYFSQKLGFKRETSAASNAVSRAGTGPTADPAGTPSTSGSTAQGSNGNGIGSGNGNGSGNGAQASTGAGGSTASSGASGGGGGSSGSQASSGGSSNGMSTKAKNPFTLSALQQALPHWASMTHGLGDQDVVALYGAEKVMQDNGHTVDDYYLATPSDVGVAAVNKWAKVAGYDKLWAGRPPPPDRTLEQLLDRRTRHTNHCAVCQKGLRQFEQAAAIIKATAFACNAAAAGLWAVAMLPDGPGAQALPAAAAATALGVGLTVLLNKVEEYKEERFICGVRAWKKKGGLSLVPEK